MNKWLWFGLVILAVLFVIFAAIYKDLFLAILGLALGLLLKQYADEIPMPKAYEKIMKRAEEAKKAREGK